MDGLEATRGSKLSALDSGLKAIQTRSGRPAVGSAGGENESESARRAVEGQVGDSLVPKTTEFTPRAGRSGLLAAASFLYVSAHEAA